MIDEANARTLTINLYLFSLINFINTFPKTTPQIKTKIKEKFWGRKYEFLKIIIVVRYWNVAKAK